MSKLRDIWADNKSIILSITVLIFCGLLYIRFLVIGNTTAKESVARLREQRVNENIFMKSRGREQDIVNYPDMFSERVPDKKVVDIREVFSDASLNKTSAYYYKPELFFAIGTHLYGDKSLGIRGIRKVFRDKEDIFNTGKKTLSEQVDYFSVKLDEHLRSRKFVKSKSELIGRYKDLYAYSVLGFYFIAECGTGYEVEKDVNELAYLISNYKKDIVNIARENLVEESFKSNLKDLSKLPNLSAALDKANYSKVSAAQLLEVVNFLITYETYLAYFDI